MLEALQLRFSLVGGKTTFLRIVSYSKSTFFFLNLFLGLFDSILRNPMVAIDWAILLTQLVTNGVVDASNNTELFTTLQDMLATLLHSTLVTDGQSDRGEDSRKYYPILIKKLKKELAERKGSPSIQCIKQLLPLPKLTSEFVTCEPYGTLTDTKVGISNISIKIQLMIVIAMHLGKHN
jgi:mediator of RNA polymerase II transcription subunit 12